MPKLKGSCLCGKVTFAVEKSFMQFHLCHCIQCQKATGSAHASNLFTQPDNIQWLSGEEYVKRFDLPGRSISNAFCTECGSGLPYLSQTGKALIVQAGTLDGSAGVIPQDNIFWSERADWYDGGIAAPHFSGFPE